MKQFLFLGLIFSILSLPCLAMHERSDSHEEYMSKWNKFTADFRDAFNCGDIDKLEELKESGRGFGFHNINDFGEGFFHYGASLEQWDNLIEDAKKNAQ